VPQSNDIERVLRAARPEPPAHFVYELEERLLPRPQAPRRVPALFRGAAFVAGLAAVVAVLGVVGVLPFGLGADRTVNATDGCRTVMVQRTEKRPDFFVAKNGELRLRYRPQVVNRPVKRCR